ncbi:TetR/AcrR family transcriptional regulator [Lactococcus sp. dk322]|uniref:TetR/AcrR family transcriptional regulator n=1 Tax=Lactococcus sp. dk322 TaxID=2603290 RepID=UPI0011CB84F7|nr:TetR/AcrR family transcriptional regulator [Lactococcus sp. dk322]TXK46785.1 TetR/AcrR family transcriptional regulator [Lactococcus sp. dk322]
MKITREDIFKESKYQLLKYGYDYFNFTSLSSALSVTRAALYKYYKSKDELIIDLMNEEMANFLKDFKHIFESKINDKVLKEILIKMAHFSDIHRLLESTFRIDYDNQYRYKDKFESLQNYHLLLNTYLNDIVDTCKSLGFFSKELDNNFIIKFITNSVNILDENSDEKNITLLENVLLNGLKQN